MTLVNRQDFSKIKEVVAGWSSIRQYLRGGDQGHLVPVVIPRDRRGYRFLFWFALALLSGATGLLTLNLPLVVLGLVAALFFLLVGAFVWWRMAIVEVEQGTTGILSRSGQITGTLSPGRHYLWWPWNKVEYIVDTSTEIPYTAPVLSSPTRENVPLKSIEFFLKFRIVEPVAFVRHIGASNFDTVLSSAVQDAIRRRSRDVETAKAYDLRGSDVGDMRQTLNRQLHHYGVTITGANIPDVQLPEQYRQNLATRERVSKELVAYEKEWELARKQRTDALNLEIERAKKERDEKLNAVQEAVNRARQDVAQMLQEREAEAEKIRLEIEAEGRAMLKAAENEARGLRSLGRSYKDNQAILQYELKQRQLEVAAQLLQSAPRPVLVNTTTGGESSALATLMLARILPDLLGDGSDGRKSPDREATTDLRQELTRLADTLTARAEHDDERRNPGRR